MKRRALLVLCGAIAVIAICMCSGSRSSAFENNEFQVTGTINGQNIDNAFNPSTAISIDLSAPITFNITFNVLTTSDITINELAVTIRIFGFDIITIAIPVDQTITGESSAEFNDVVNFGQFLEVGNGFSILGGTYDIGVTARYTVADTSEQKSVARDVYLNIDAPIYASITGLASLGSVGLVGGKTLISRPKTVMGATSFGASSSGSGYFVGQQLGWMSFDLTTMILTIVAVCIACGLVGYLILHRKKSHKPECLVQNNITYCKTGNSSDSKPKDPSKIVELNIDQLTDFITYKRKQ